MHPVLNKVVSLFRNRNNATMLAPKDAPVQTGKPAGAFKPSPIVTEFDVTEYSGNFVPLGYLIEKMEPNHAAQIIRGEFWRVMIGNTDSFTRTGDGTKFWMLVRALGQIEQPLGFIRGVNPFTGLNESRPINDPMEIAAQILKANRERKLAPVKASDFKSSAKWLGKTPESLADEENARRTEQNAVAVEAEGRSLRRLAGQSTPTDEMDDYLIPQTRVLSKIVESAQWNLSNIKDAVFREAEALLWEQELGYMKSVHCKGTERKVA